MFAVVYGLPTIFKANITEYIHPSLTEIRHKVPHCHSEALAKARLVTWFSTFVAAPLPLLMQIELSIFHLIHRDEELS